RKLLALHTADPKPLRDLRRDVDVGLARVVARMLAREPAERYQTPLALAHALAPFLSVPVELPPLEAVIATAEAAAEKGLPGSAITARPDPSHSRLRPLTAHPSGLPLGTSQIARPPAPRHAWLRKHPRLAAGLAGAVALVAV